MTRQSTTTESGYQTVGAAHAALTRGYPTEPSLQEVLEATSDEGLLKAFASLTHRIHGSQFASHEREQRDLVQAEVLRRMAGAR